MNRRKFLTGLLGFVAAPAVVRAASIMPISPLENIVAETDYGFTFGPVNTYDATFDEIVRETLRKKSHLLADNVTRNNILLSRLNGNNYLKINKITPELQTQRMIDKLENRRLALQSKRISSIQERVKWSNEIAAHNMGANIFYESYEDLTAKYGV